MSTEPLDLDAEVMRLRRQITKNDESRLDHIAVESTILRAIILERQTLRLLNDDLRERLKEKESINA